MKNVTAMTEELKLPTVSSVNNLPGIVTATMVNPNGSITADRIVITYAPKAQRPYGIYREELRWDQANWVWQHTMYTAGTYRSTYQGAFRNLEFRLYGTSK